MTNVFPEIGNVLYPLAQPGTVQVSFSTRIGAVQRAVCVAFGIDMSDLLSDRRARVYARPRQAAYLLCKRHTMASLPTIGKHFSDRDHTTVMYGIGRAEELIKSDKNFAEMTKNAERMIS